MQATAANYPWAEELEKTVINSLVTTFSLDFLLFKDKIGGDVNTIHNTRQNIWATEQEKMRYDNRGNYSEKSGEYHQHENYKATGARDKQLQEAGKLHDVYRAKAMARDEQRNLDHVIAAKEIHDDPGRVLADVSGVELANRISNLQTTHESINKSKKQTPTSIYLKKLPNLIASNEENLAKDIQQLASMPRGTPEQLHKARQLEDEIRKTKNKIKTLKSIDPKAMLSKDKSARKEYDAEINQRYYTSSKFLGSTVYAAGKSGLKMGTRQMLGMILAEFWFELRSSLPQIIKKLQKNFKLEIFIAQIKLTLRKIWIRIQNRFQDFLIAFKDGVFSGVFASLMTTLINIFASTGKKAIKIIREMWGHLIKAIKLLALNPQQLPFVDLCKAVLEVINTGSATIVGSLAYTELAVLCNFPFGGELATFCGALVTGVLTLGLNYLIIYSPTAQRLWDVVQKMTPHNSVVLHFQAINAELDRYLSELARTEFNLNQEEMQKFNLILSECASELERGLVLNVEVEKRGIELPFEIGNSQTTRKWLASLAKS